MINIINTYLPYLIEVIGLYLVIDSFRIHSQAWEKYNQKLGWLGYPLPGENASMMSFCFGMTMITIPGMFHVVVMFIITIPTGMLMSLLGII